MTCMFGVYIGEDHDKIPALIWLPKLHKIPYKLRLIANQGTTNEGVDMTSKLKTADQPTVTQSKQPASSSSAR